MNITTVVLDFGGVLVRTADRSSRQKWERELGLNDNQLDDIVFGSEIARLATIGKAEMEDIWLNVQKELSLSDTQLEELLIDFWVNDQLDQCLIKAFVALRSNFRTAILSNIWTGGRQYFQDKFGIKEGLTADRIFVSCEMGLAKPDPEIYQVMANELDVQLTEIFFVDDFIENIEVAKTLGMHTHLFTNPHEAIYLLNRMVF